MHKTVFIWDDELTTYRFSEQHPLNPRRLQLAYQEITRRNLLAGADVIVLPPRTASISADTSSRESSPPEGKQRVNVVPWPGSLSTQMCPPFWVTMP